MIINNKNNKIWADGRRVGVEDATSTLIHSNCVAYAIKVVQK